jgi:hypothetical protein
MVGGDVFEIIANKTYPADHGQCSAIARKERDENYRPSLSTHLKNMDCYDVIFLGSPIWWYTVASPVVTFLSEYNFSGKTIAPFVTHGGGGISRCITDIMKLCPQSTVLDGLEVYGRSGQSMQNEVSMWLRKIGVE